MILCHDIQSRRKKSRAFIVLQTERRFGSVGPDIEWIQNIAQGELKLYLVRAIARGLDLNRFVQASGPCERNRVEIEG